MKKLLTLLLTFVLAVCLANLDSNHSKAEDTSSNVDVGSVLETSNVDAHLIKKTGPVDLDDGSHDDDKNTLGIQHDYTNHVLKLSYDLSNSTGDVFNIHTTEKIVLLNSIKLSTTSSGNQTISFDQNIEINGGDNVNTLTIKPTTDAGIGIVGPSNKLTLKKINLVIDGDFSMNIRVGDLMIDEYSSVVLKTTNSSGNALTVYGNVYMPEDYEILGSTSSNPSETDLKIAVLNSQKYKVADEQGNLQDAKYIVIRKKQQPKPDPAPSQPKDESCEKIIGPTWHWNNDKGVCEEYATVGTSTR